MTILISKDRIIRLFDQWEKHAEIKGYFHHRAFRNHILGLYGDLDYKYIEKLDESIGDLLKLEKSPNTTGIISGLEMARFLYTGLKE